MYELILCIVNNGFADNVMEVAKECGAKGGTVINARGTAREEAEKRFNIAINPEKEILLLVIDKNIKDDILHGIYQNCGLDTPGQGICFSLPVDDVVGLSPINIEDDEEESA